MDLINAYKYLKGRCKEDRARLLSVVPGDRTRGNEHKLKYRKVHLNPRKHIFVVRMVKYWYRVPRVESPTSEKEKEQVGTGCPLQLAVVLYKNSHI